MKVIDLDVLRPEKKILKLNGKEIDVGFIPCAITFDVDGIMKEIIALDRDEVQKGGESARKAFELSVKMCATFCMHKYPELDEEWFMDNASPQQVRIFAESIQEALQQAYAGIETPPKAVKHKKE